MQALIYVPVSFILVFSFFMVLSALTSFISCPQSHSQRNPPPGLQHTDLKRGSGKQWQKQRPSTNFTEKWHSSHFSVMLHFFKQNLASLSFVLHCTHMVWVLLKKAVYSVWGIRIEWVLRCSTAVKQNTSWVSALQREATRLCQQAERQSWTCRENSPESLLSKVIFCSAGISLLQPLILDKSHPCGTMQAWIFCRNSPAKPHRRPPWGPFGVYSTQAMEKRRNGSRRYIGTKRRRSVRDEVLCNAWGTAPLGWTW